MEFKVYSFIVIVIFFLVGSIRASYSEDQEKSRALYKACLKEHNISDDFYEAETRRDLGNLTVDEFNNKVYCDVGCRLKSEEKNGRSMYRIIEDEMKTLKKTELDDALKQKLISCANVGDDACLFLKCLDLEREPFNYFVRFAKLGDFLQNFLYLVKPGEVNTRRLHKKYFYRR